VQDAITAVRTIGNVAELDCRTAVGSGTHGITPSASPVLRPLKRRARQAGDSDSRTALVANVEAD
jgi:hypothetical protein